MVVALAQALGHHLCVPNQYMGGGLLVKGIQGVWFDSGRNDVYSGVSTEAPFGKLLCWDDISPKRGKYKLGPLDACHRSRCREPSTLIRLGKAMQ